MTLKSKLNKNLKSILFIAMGIFLGFCFIAEGASNGPNNSTIISDDNSTGTITWTNPGNATSSNNIYATASLDDNQISHYLKATNFGFSIPSGATINGIIVEVEKKAGNASRIQDYSVRIVKGGTIGTTNKADASWWGTGDAYSTYGSSTELWGQTWTASDINDANFGVAFSAYKNTASGNAITASVDNIRVTIAYTINKQDQSPLSAIADPSSLSYGSTSALSISGGSGTGAVTFSSGASTGCAVNSSTLSVIDASGNCFVTATKTGDTNYNATTSPAITVTLSKANQAITFGALADKSIGAADFDVSATSNSGLTVSFASQTTGVCTVSTNTVSLVSTGTCTIRATQIGNTNYNATTPVDQSFIVTPSATKFVITSATDGTIDLASLVTIEAQTGTGDLVSNYQEDVTLVTSGGATGGGLVNIVNGIGTTTISDNTLETVHLSLQDTEHTNLDVSSTRDISFGPGSTASLSLSSGSTTQLIAGERLPLVVSRRDRLNNTVTLGSESFYLYSNASNPARKFYDAPDNGNIVNTILIPNSYSSATIWYYDDKVGTPTITASDNSSSPDGATGIDDATLDISVISAPALTLFLSNPGDLVAGNRLAYDISRQDQFGNPSDNGSLTVYLYQYSSSSTTAFYDTSSGGNKINHLTLNPGIATSSFWLYGEKAEDFSLTVSDNSSSPDGTTGVNDASDNLSVKAGPVSTFTLNNPGDVLVGTRAGYSVSRLDSFGNPVTAGETTVYLFQNDTVGTSTEFFDAAEGGTAITFLSIADTFSSRNFWLYPSGVSSYNVTVSETTPANGATGIIDATDPIIILAAPIIPTRIVILDTTPTTVGETASIAVQVQDGAGNVDTSFSGSITLHTNGSATPGGIISLSGGVGSINIIDTKAETVNLTLEDTGRTGLDVSSNKTINFLSGPTQKFIVTGNLSALAGERINYTINRQDQYNNAVTSGSETIYLYSNALPGTSNFYNAASGGTQISSASILDGEASTNVYFAGTMAGTIVAQASDNSSAPDGGVGITDGTSTLAISPAATARLSLNDPGDMFNGTRLGYTATRYDAYNNLVTAGGVNYYLYSNAHGTSTSFYPSAESGSPITNLSFSNAQSTANFWYYETKNGTWTIYISDNSSAPDGANGIFDGEDGVIVSAIPIVATKFIIIVPNASVLINTPTTITIRAVNDNNDIDTSYNGAITLKTSGSASGEGLVTIINGVGEKIINDSFEEIINLSLQDTEHTGLGFSDTKSVTFSKTADVPTGGGGGGGVSAPTISFSGLAFPNASVEIMAIQDGQVPIGSLGKGGSGGNFNTIYRGNLPTSIKSFALVVYDKAKNIAQTKIYKLGVNDQLFKTLLMSPTIELTQDQVTLGAFAGITGSAMPSYKIELMIDSVKAPEFAMAKPNGDYSLTFNTYRLGTGPHTLKVRQVDSQGKTSDYSLEKNFSVIRSFIPKADFNKDGKVNVADWGIFMSRYQSDNLANKEGIDLNGDGKVNAQDLSLLMEELVR